MANYTPTFYIKFDILLNFLTEMSRIWKIMTIRDSRSEALIIANIHALLNMSTNTLNTLILIYDFFKSQLYHDVQDGGTLVYDNYTTRRDSIYGTIILDDYMTIELTDTLELYNTINNAPPITEFMALLDTILAPFSNTPIKIARIDDISANITTLKNSANPMEVYRAIAVHIPQIDLSTISELSDKLWYPSSIPKVTDDMRYTWTTQLIEIFMKYINSSKLGSYWSYDIKSAKAHWGGGNPNVLRINTFLHHKDIDWLSTILLNIFNPSEHEIRGMPNTYVKINTIFWNEDSITCEDINQCLAYV
jgi:hypothetical protein